MAIFIRYTAPLFCFFFLFSLFSHQTMSQPQHMHTFCDDKLSDNFTQTSSYKSNRETLLSSLRDRSSLGTYSNATIGLSPDTVHGMFLCRGDLTKTSCSDCVKTATLEITKNNCTYRKTAIIYYEECMVRYSNVSFFTLVEDGPYVVKYPVAFFPTSLFSSFQKTLSTKLEQLIILTSSKSSLSSSTPYYVKDKSRVNDFEGSYTLDTMVQCSPDLDPANCSACLRLAAQSVSGCCTNARWAHFYLPKCFLKYDTTGLPSSQSPSGASSINVMKGLYHS
ncbi:PREDICTED: cysteine-rich repeat secretory protein 8-like [Camelina sativa]|uniref:Cysteine-rich repeat secretory protein 8-like n=1 Tax=Camelina sativa TaxID=90675 RepID=A0ABM0T1G9_CAMSA|nr:PREDICTED: cysteine-rich repeat secretory protein 8-like [Camelina sativa]XP_010474603.1 PREDICTED: cysteine-rich repeat secretory protein 8-like [Camelina sativa]